MNARLCATSTECEHSCMCHSDASRPPAPPRRGDLGPHADIVLTAGDGSRFDAYEAHPATTSTRGIVILPDNRGLHEYYKQLARYLAEAGFHAVAIDYYARTAGRGDRSEAFDYVPHWKQATNEGVDADVLAAAAHLRSLGVASLFTLGFCFGGGNSWRQAALIDDLAGAIGFYGRPDGVLALQRQVHAPLLMLLGGADQMIDPAAFDALLADMHQRGIDAERRVYADAPHSFFDRTYAEHGDECADAWHRILAFTDRHA